MGLLTTEEFGAVWRAARPWSGFEVAPSAPLVLLRSGYAAHVRRQRPPPSMPPPPGLPPDWGPVERCRVAEVAYAKGHWQRPSWQGRFAGQPAALPMEDDGLAVAWVLLEREKAGPLNSGAKEALDIDWSEFSFQHGFKPKPPKPSQLLVASPGKLNGSLVPPDIKASAVKSEPDGAVAARAPAPRAQLPLPPQPASAASLATRPGTGAEQTLAGVGSRLRTAPGSPVCDAVREVLATTISAVAASAGVGGTSQAAPLPAPSASDAPSLEATEQLGPELGPPALPALHRSDLPPPSAPSQPLTAAAAPNASLAALGFAIAAATPVPASEAAAAESAEGIGDEGRAVTRSRRGRVSGFADLYELEHGTTVVVARRAAEAVAEAAVAAREAAAAAEADEEAAGLGAEGSASSMRFWGAGRDLGAVGVYVRPGLDLDCSFLLAPRVFEATAGRPWLAGTPIKMPVGASLARALASPNAFRWLTGLVAATYRPRISAVLPLLGQPAPAAGTASPAVAAASAAARIAGEAADPWKALNIQWDVDVASTWPRHVSPWEVLEDPGGALRAQKERLRAEEMARVQQAQQAANARALARRQAEEAARQQAATQVFARAAAARMHAERAVQAQAAAEQARRDMAQRAAALQASQAREAGRLVAGGQLFMQPPLQAGSMLGHLPPGGMAHPQPHTPLPQPAVRPAASAAAAGFRPLEVPPRGSSEGPAVWPHLGPLPGQALGQPPLWAGQMRSKPALAMACAPSSQPPLDASSLAGLVAGLAGGAGMGQRATGPEAAGAVPPTPSTAAVLNSQERPAAMPARPAAPPAAGVSAAPPGCQGAPTHSTAPAGASVALGLQGSVAPPAAAAAAVYAMPDPVMGVVAGQRAPAPAPGPAAASQAAAESEKGSGGKKRGRPAGKKRVAAEGEDAERRAACGEGYRERWLAKKPRPTLASWLSGICSACERSSELVICAGPCLRAFHPGCIRSGSPPLPALGALPWFCPECDTGRMRCFACGEFGAGFEDPTIRKCSLGVCGRFYHMGCVAGLAKAQQAKKGGHFRCPQHYCGACGKSGDGVDMVKCVRCATAYHSCCMPRAIRRIAPHAKMVLCDKHPPEEGPPGYAMPPPPDPTKLASALQAGRAAGLATPNIKGPADRKQGTEPAYAPGGSAHDSSSGQPPQASKPQAAGNAQAPAGLAAGLAGPPQLGGRLQMPGFMQVHGSFTHLPSRPPERHGDTPYGQSAPPPSAVPSMDGATCQPSPPQPSPAKTA